MQTVKGSHLRQPANPSSIALSYKDTANSLTGSYSLIRECKCHCPSGVKGGTARRYYPNGVCVCKLSAPPKASVFTRNTLTKNKIICLINDVEPLNI